MSKAQTPHAGHSRADRTAIDDRGLYRRLLASVRRRFGVQDAEDVVQDVFLRMTYASERSSVRNKDAYVHSVALNLVRDRGRAAATRAAVAGEFDENTRSLEPDAWQIISSRQQLAILEAALAELPQKRRAALVLRRFDGLTYLEIAETLGLSVSMVEKHVRLGLDHCRRRLAEANGDVL